MFSSSWAPITVIPHHFSLLEAYHVNIHVSSGRLFSLFSIIGSGLQNTLHK
jgi:hypothetical protein